MKRILVPLLTWEDSETLVPLVGALAKGEGPGNPGRNRTRPTRGDTALAARTVDPESRSR